MYWLACLFFPPFLVFHLLEVRKGVQCAPSARTLAVKHQSIIRWLQQLSIIPRSSKPFFLLLYSLFLLFHFSLMLLAPILKSKRAGGIPNWDWDAQYEMRAPHARTRLYCSINFSSAWPSYRPHPPDIFWATAIDCACQFFARRLITKYCRASCSCHISRSSLLSNVSCQLSSSTYDKTT